jgi:regulator of protease activity HflC (stomatin/prohibitin superfamily)/Zn-finger nucleic acid-binding protein
MNCIKCQKEVISASFQGLDLLLCKTCNTVCLKEAEFWEICKRLGVENEVKNPFELQPISVNEPLRKCPYCGKDMAKTHQNGILIDRCDECRVLGFDNGELSKFFANYTKPPITLMNNATFLKNYCNAKKHNDEFEAKPIQLQSQEKEYSAVSTSGWVVISLMAIFVLPILICFFIPFLIPVGIILGTIFMFITGGFRILNPQEALVLTVFGKYVGTLRGAGFHWVNPFARSKTDTPISLKARTLENGKQKINDELGNPIEVGIIVVWEVQDTAKAVFNVDNYPQFLAAQSDCALRNIVRMYPYDTPEDSHKQSLRGDSMEISEKLKKEIQRNVTEAGINVVDARITHLAYAPEIAVAMLQRQQASAVIDAKRSIVDGAVGMVELALNKLEQNKNIVLDEKTKANMVNNLLVVLCANKESQPVIRNDIY